MVAKERPVYDHNERFPKSQYFKACSSSSMGDHTVRTFHVLKIDLSDLDHFDRYLCQRGLVGPGVGCEGKTGRDLHLAGSSLRV